MNAVHSYVSEVLTTIDGRPLGKISPVPGTNEYRIPFTCLGKRTATKRMYDQKTLLFNIFDKTSLFQRRLISGALDGEYGHPVMSTEPPSENDVRRIFEIDLKKVCFQITKIGRSTNSEGDSLIWGQLLPKGPYGPSFKESLELEKSNTAVSLRSLVRHCPKTGVLYPTCVVTYDAVNMPGDIRASKRFSHDVSMEHMTQAIAPAKAPDLNNAIYDSGDIKHLLCRIADEVGVTYSTEGVEGYNFLEFYKQGEAIRHRESVDFRLNKKRTNEVLRELAPTSYGHTLLKSLLRK